MESALFEIDLPTGLEPGIPGGGTPPSTAGGTPAATEARFMEKMVFIRPEGAEFRQANGWNVAGVP
jgi:hypothetical protein